MRAIQNRLGLGLGLGLGLELGHEAEMRAIQNSGCQHDSVSLVFTT